MHVSIPVWQTLSDAFVFVAHHLEMLFNALIIPLLLAVAVEAGFLFVSDLESPLFILKAIIDVLIYAWMINVSCRVVITEQAGPARWTSAETWTAVWLLCLTLVISLLSAAGALAVIGVLFWAPELLRMGAAGVTFALLHVYLFARFLLIFPATAMGDKSSFREAWELSSGNGWRLVLLFFLVPFLYAMLAMILGSLLPVRIFQSVLVLVSIFFCLVGVVAVALAYKKLSP